MNDKEFENFLEEAVAKAQLNAADLKTALEDLKAARCTPKDVAVVEPWRGPRNGAGGYLAAQESFAENGKMFVGFAGSPTSLAAGSHLAPAQIYEMCHALLERAMIVEGVSLTMTPGPAVYTREILLRRSLNCLKAVVEAKS